MESVLKEFAIRVQPKPELQPAQLALAFHGQTLREMARKGGESALDRSLALQVYASLYPLDSEEQNQLWERSLIALESVRPDSPGYRVLKARAIANLQRRPYALKVLGTPSSDMEQALHAYLMGDLPLAGAANGRVSDPFFHFLAAAEIQRLRRYYERQAGYSQRRKKIVASLAAWDPLVGFRFSSADWLGDSRSFAVASLLQKEGVGPRVGPGNSLFFRLSAILRLAGVPMPSSEADLSADIITGIEDTRENLWRQRSPEWVHQTGDRRLQEWDYFDLLYETNIVSAREEVENVAMQQGHPKEAKKRIDALRDTFQGNPEFLAAQAFVDWQLSRLPEMKDRKHELRRKTYERARDVYSLEGGETHLSHLVEWYFREMHRPGYGKYYDEPMRWYRRYFSGGKPIHNFNQLGDNVWRRKIELATFGTQTLQYYFKLLRRRGRKEQANKLADENRNRFIGSRFWANRLIEVYGGRDESTAIAALQKGLKRDPGAWVIRRALIKRQFARKDYRKAQSLLLKSPDFRFPNEDSVGNTNRLGEMGIRLEDADQFDLAIPVYKKASSYDTYAWHDLYAKERLAYLDEDFSKAAEFALKNAERYNGKPEKKRYMKYLFALGQDNEAWGYLDHYVQKWFIPRYPIRMGMRINHFSRKQVLQWIREEHAEHNKLILPYRLLHLYFLAFVVGKHPLPDDIRTIAQLSDELKTGDFLKNWFTGYAYYRRGEYRAAVKWLKPASDHMVEYSKKIGKPVNYVLPYLVSCMMQEHQPERGRAEWLHSRKIAGRGFYDKTAGALLAGYNGHVPQALSLLHEAHLAQTKLDYKPIEPGLHLVEMAEDLLRFSRRREYRDFIVHMAEATQRSKLTIWAPAVQLQYDVASRNNFKILARAIFLDDTSYRLKSVPRKQLDQARRWLQENRAYY
jgi:hypothetical protein